MNTLTTCISGIMPPDTSSGKFLCSSGSWEPVYSNVELGESAKNQVAEIVKNELGKLLLELSESGDFPLTELAKEYFIKKL